MHLRFSMPGQHWCGSEWRAVDPEFVRKRWAAILGGVPGRQSWGWLSTHPSRRDLETNMVQRSRRPYWPKAAYLGPWQSLRSRSHGGTPQTRPRSLCFGSPSYNLAWLQLLKEWQHIRVCRFHAGVFRTGYRPVPFWANTFAFLKSIFVRIRVVIFYG